MGWNSWDCYGTTVTEAQTKANADYMARNLKSYGWQYIVVDIEWYQPTAQGHEYMAGAKLAMDDFSRLVPAPEKFPSAADGAGFKPLADYVHSLGLKFGIHMMRGISRQAVQQNTPIKGSTAKAADIANTSSTCAWNPDMYGVDMTKPGSQEYYDSLMDLVASWGVDFIKVDDMSCPYTDGQKAELEAIRKGIDKTGRPIVFSLSPGKTPIERGNHVTTHANMWRIADDFWDNWKSLYAMMALIDQWTPYRAPGAWPDADMLPLGIVDNRPTHFTRDEQKFCMTAWCIGRSPLIFGGDMTRMDQDTLSLLTNSEVLTVNQASTNNKQLSRKDDIIIWTAEVPNSPDRFVAFFNAQSNDLPYDLSKAVFRSPVIKASNVADISAALGNTHHLTLLVTDGGDGFAYDHSAWIEPTLTGPNGTLKLTDLTWTSATAGWGSPKVNKTIDDTPITFNGAPAGGIGTHSVSVIQYNIPEGYETLTAHGILTEGSEGKGSVEFVVLTDAADKAVAASSPISISFADLGIAGHAKVRDLWAGKDLGVFDASFSQDLPVHGAALFRISPQKNP